MTIARPVFVGARGSALAVRQAEEVVRALGAAHPRTRVEVRRVSTRGDRHPGASLASLGRGVFVKELEAVLLSGELDLAVHSLKDMPTEPTPGLRLVAVPSRGDPRDVLVSRGGTPLARLPSRALVGTGSPRRAFQLRALRRDLRVREIRGNVETRLRKLRRGEYDAVVLAAAGLHRLGLQRKASEYLDPYRFAGAPGQGALGVQAREDDEAIAGVAAAADDPPTRAAVGAERAFLRELGGGCALPVAAFAEIREGLLWLRGVVGQTDGDVLLAETHSGPPETAEELGRELARRLRGRQDGG